MNRIFLSLLVLFAFSSTSQAILISEVDLANNKVELINDGPIAIDLTGWWWCNRVNGSPFYQLVTSGSTIDTTLSSPGATLTNFGVGQLLVLDVPSAFLPDALGEFSIYNTNSFGSSTAIEDYLAWNSTGIRDTPAASAGLWILNTSIDTTGILPGQTLQTVQGTQGVGPTEWVITGSTLGYANGTVADVTLTLNRISGQLTSIGGGGATPVDLGPIAKADANPAGASISDLLIADGIARDGAGNDRGSGTGSGFYSGSTSVVGNTISGSGNVTSDLVATGDLGSALSDSRLAVEIRFVVNTPANYLFSGTLSSATGPVGNIDSITLTRIGNPFTQTLELVNKVQNPVIGATGTLNAAEYVLEVSLNTNVAGGTAQSPASDDAAFSFSLEISPTPTFGGLIIPDFSELRIRQFDYDADDNPFISFDSIQGVDYKVTTSPDLQPPWIDVPDATIIGTGGTATIGFPVSTESSRFYRIEKAVLIF